MQGGYGGPRVQFYLCFLLAAALGAVVLALFAFDVPTWSEEQGWLRIGKLIASGERLNPLLPKSDYPSSFQAFPIGALIGMGVAPLPASRIIAIIYALIAAYFFGRIFQVFCNNEKGPLFLVMVTSVATYNTASYVVTGWHEVTHVNLLGAAATFFLLRLLYQPSESITPALLLGLVLGMSLWTLYTPAVAAGAVIVVLIASYTWSNDGHLSSSRAWDPLE